MVNLVRINSVQVITVEISHDSINVVGVME